MQEIIDTAYAAAERIATDAYVERSLALAMDARNGAVLFSCVVSLVILSLIVLYVMRGRFDKSEVYSEVLFPAGMFLCVLALIVSLTMVATYSGYVVDWQTDPATAVAKELLTSASGSL